jgi:fibrillarin-like rRNA methylase
MMTSVAEAVDVHAILARDTEVSALEPSTDTTRLHAETTTVIMRNQTVVVVNSGHVLCVITIRAIQITNQPVVLFVFRQVKLPILRQTKRNVRRFWTLNMQPGDHSVV